MRKQIGRAPQQFDAGALLFLLQHLDDGVEILVGLGEVCAFRRDVAVVEGVEGRAELLDELEGDARAVLGVLDRSWSRRPTGRMAVPTPNGIAAGAAEGVPVDNREAQMFRMVLPSTLSFGL